MKGDIIMDGLLTYDNYENGGIELFKYCVKHGNCISAEGVEDFIDNNYELIEDEGSDDFTDINRWTIGKYYIVNIDGDHYRCWEEVGLTEMQSNEWYDQTFEKVELRKKVVTEWETL